MAPDQRLHKHSSAQEIHRAVGCMKRQTDGSTTNRLHTGWGVTQALWHSKKF
jgi:hypothetical protein